MMESGCATSRSSHGVHGDLVDAMDMAAENILRTTELPWTAVKENFLLAPYNYLSRRPGKNVRSQLIRAFNEWFHLSENSLQTILKAVEMLHTASLLVDDVQDSSPLRRGVPSAHVVFGSAQTINSANYAYFEALDMLFELRSFDVIRIFKDELLNLHRGQGMELYWRDNLICPRLDEYVEMANNKTGGLFRLAIRLMAAESAVFVDCLALINTIGLLFQILDDFLNLSTYQHTKGFCEDLSEGKFSFPIIHAIWKDPSSSLLINILKQRTSDDELKKVALSYLADMSSFEYSRIVIFKLHEKTNALIDEVELQLGEQENGVSGGNTIKTILDRLVAKIHASQAKSNGATHELSAI